MNNKKLINDRKEILRQHLKELHRSGFINQNELIRDGAYYAKNVIPYLAEMGHVTPAGKLIRTFTVEDIIQTLWTTKPRKPKKEIALKSAKQIGQKMSKSRIDMAEIIKQNSTGSYEDRAALDREHCIDVKPIANPLESFSDNELCFEITRRGWSGKLTKSMEV